MQRITLIGNLGKDAVIQDAGNQNAINFSVAVSEKFKNKDGVATEQTTWYDCTFWKKKDQSTEVAKFLLKGQKVFLEGKPTADIFTDAKTAEIRVTNRVSVSKVELL